MGKSHFLRLSGKWINSSGVSSQKLSYVYEAPAGAFISDKLTFLEISDMPILEKVCISLSKWGIPERDIWSLHAMGWGSGQIEKLARRRRRRRHLENVQI